MTQTTQTAQDTPKLPRDVYKFKVIDTDDRQSRAQNKMMVLTCEIVEAEKHIDEEKDVVIDPNGIRCTMFVPLVGPGKKESGEMSEGTAWRVNQLRRAVIESDLEEIEKDEVEEEKAINYKGVTFYAIASSSQDTQKQESGKALINPHTGEPVKVTRYNIERILTPQD